MRILIVTQYFEPEVTAASLRLAPLAAGLAARGHDVRVVCEVPNHPAGVIAERYRGRALARERVDGYSVHRVWVRASESKRARDRLLSYASFTAAGTAAGSLGPRPDVVVASSPPLSVGVAGAAIALRHRRPLVLDVRDLWPEIAVALGEVSEGRVLDTAEVVERRLYERAAAVTTPTAPFREQIVANGADRDKVHVVPNGTTADWLRAGEAPADRAALGPAGEGNTFVWTYAGNVGLSQDLGVAVEASRILGEGFRLLVLGGGTSMERVRELAADVPGLVAFRDAVPQVEAMRVMRASDALLVSLTGVPELGRSVPVKLYDSCAIGRPVVVAAPGEPARLAGEAGAALVVPPGDAAALAAAVRRLRDEDGLAGRLVEAGRAFAASHLREDTVGPLETVLESVVRA